MDSIRAGSLYAALGQKGGVEAGHHAVLSEATLLQSNPVQAGPL